MRAIESVPLFGQIATQALNLAREHGDPALAWAQAASEKECSQSTREKGCPKAAFISLAQNGYLNGVSSALGPSPLNKNARYALTAAQLVFESPDLRDKKTELWAAVRAKHGIERRSQNGVLDVLFALLDLDALKN